jgi:class 3 adenylate cyclase
MRTATVPDFAKGCGLRLALACDSCGAELRAGARYCDACGAPVGGCRTPHRPPPPDAAGPVLPEHLAEKVRLAGGALEGERKQVTVLFADVQGSMELAESVDAELWRALVNRFFALVCEAVHRFEGT